MDRLMVDAAVLEGMRADLDAVGRELDDPGPRAGLVADAVGASDLGAALMAFADGWDRRRTDLVDALRALRDGVDTTARVFTEVDERLASAVEQGGSSTGPQGHR